MKNSSSPFQKKWSKKQTNKNDNKEAEFKFCKRPFFFCVQNVLFPIFSFFFFKLPSKGKFCQIPFCCKVPGKTPLQPMVRIEFLWGYSPDSKHPVPVGKPKQNPPLKSSYKYYKEEILRYLLTTKINF